MNDCFHFRVGDYSCIALRDKDPRYPIATFFTNVAADRYEGWLRDRGEDPAQIEIPYICLVVDTGRDRVLVDTGIGAYGSPPGQLLNLLRSSGIDPRDIGTVFLTHAHPDHVNGCLDAEGRPAFPNARYLIGRKEREFWMSTPSLEGTPIPADYRKILVAAAQKNLQGVQAALELVEPEAEIAPGIRAIALFGHTPGQLGLEISSAGERLLFAADAIIHPLNLRYPEAIARVDYNPEEMVATRMRFLEKAARDKSLVATSHFPFPGVGYVIPEGNRWEWKPIWESEARPQHAGV